MESYKREFIDFLKSANLLKFGDFTAKSGRKIPYFINAGEIKTGEQIAKLGEFYASQIFWLVVFFGLAFFIVGRGMVPKVMDTVAHRDKQISDDFAAAEQARREADVQEEAWRARENARRAEAQAVSDMLRRLAIAHPAIRFSLSGDHVTGFDWAADGGDADGRLRRLGRALGRDFPENALPLDAARSRSMASSASV